MGVTVATGPVRARRVRQLFEAALAKPADQHAAFLAGCEDDTTLREEVAALLANLAGARTAVGADVAPAPMPGLVGRRLGPYRIVEHIGAGGMGAVYLAERDDTQYQRRVAIKVLQHGLGSSEAVARFRDERRILAKLDHPNIVGLLDGGSTDEGLPYLVMEYVEGLALTTYVRERSCTVRERVDLIRRLCPAVQYAHGRLVVHRDLKPSNILVGKDGEPKLLDFGIAKLLGPAVDHESKTRTGMAPLTPAYASPEQVRGQAISVATDVYSLGAVLYELLTGVPPQRASADALEMMHAICEVAAPRPSTVAAPAVQRELTGDLDNILLKALQKDPARRYASIEQLADDLQRYLDGRPVTARTPTLAYRASKFVRRNRGKVALGLAVTCALATATIVSVLQARRAEQQATVAAEQTARAERRFEQVRSLANVMLFELNTKLQNVSGTTEARQLMVTRALAYLDRLAADGTSDRELSRELALAYMKVGDIQGNGYEPNLGDAAAGLESYRKAAAIVARLRTSGDSSPATRRIEATAALGIGVQLHMTNQLVEARRTLVAALDRVRGLPEARVFDRHVFRAYLSLGYIDRLDGDPRSSLAWSDQLVAIARGWQAANPSADTRYALGVSLDFRAEQRLVSGDPETARDEILEARTYFDQLATQSPGDSRFARERAYVRILLAQALTGLGNAEIWIAGTGGAGAAAEVREALAVAQGLATDRDNIQARAFVSFAAVQLASILAREDAKAAAALFEETLVNFEQLPADYQQNDPDRWYFYCSAGESLARVGKREAASKYATRGLEIAGQRDKTRLQMCRYLVARALRVLGDAPQAIALLDQAHLALEDIRTTRPHTTTSYLGIADTVALLAELRPADACKLHAQALAAWQAWPDKATPFIEKQVAALEQRRAGCR